MTTAGHRRPVPVPDPVRRVLAVVAIARAAQFVEAILFPLVAVEHGAGTAGAAVVLLCLATGTTAGSIAGGMLVDAVGTRTAALAGLAGAAGAAAGLAAGTEISILAPAATAYGVTGAIWRLALEGAATHGLAKARESDGDNQALRERAFGALIWLVNLGALASAGVLAAGVDFRSAVAAQAAALALAALAAAGMLPKHRPGPIRPAGFRSVPRAVWLLALAYAPFTMVMFQAFAGLAEVFADEEYRRMVLVNATTLVVFPLLLWRVVSALEGVTALCVAGALQGAGIATGALTGDPVFSTVVWSAGEATLIAVIPAVIAGIAPHPATGHYRAAFALVQGAAAAAATLGGPLLAGQSPTSFALACLALTTAGIAAMTLQTPVVRAGLGQPVACPCGALLCACDVQHADCAFPSPILVHGASTKGRPRPTPTMPAA